MKNSENVEKRCKCPYCDISESAPAPFCGGKETKLHFCSECGCLVPRPAQRCPSCGAKLKEVSKYKCD